MIRSNGGLFRRLAGPALGIALLLGCAGQAEAHRLKMFVTVEDGEIAGYAFFIGGGRPEGVDFVVKTAAGAEVFRGKTDDQGNFHWRPTAAADYAITVDAGDGHRVEGSIGADRLATIAAAVPAASAEASPSTGSSAPVAGPAPLTAPRSQTAAATPGPTLACPAPIDPAATARMVEAAVDKAVARQLRPMIEAYDQAEGRLRFNDVMGGIGMIVGLAGAGLWATSRRRRPGDGA